MSALKPGDRVIYTGSQFPAYWDLELTVEKVMPHLNCRYPEADRPGGYGLTTWLDPNDLILTEA
jgi:hypothetical protein